MHAFLTAKVASVDPAFLSSIQQAWICADAVAAVAASQLAGEDDDDDEDEDDVDDTGSILRVTVIDS